MGESLLRNMIWQVGVMCLLGVPALASMPTGVRGDGVADLYVLGDRRLVIGADGLVVDGTEQSLLSGFILRSTQGLLTGADYEHVGVFRVDTDHEISDQFFGGQGLSSLHELGPVLGPGLEFAQLQSDLTVTYTADGHTGIHTAGIIGIGFGDANLDGWVDDDDLSLLLANWQGDCSSEPLRGWGLGDFNGVAPVDDDDLSLLLANWTGSPSAVVGSVPEPTVLALLCLAWPISLRRRRQRQ
jgi:hypothetical protein